MPNVPEIKATREKILAAIEARRDAEIDASGEAWPVLPDTIANAPTNPGREARAMEMALDEVLKTITEFRLPNTRRDNKARWTALRHACGFLSGRPKDAVGELKADWGPVVQQWIKLGRRIKPRRLAVSAHDYPKGWTFHGYPADKRAYFQSPSGRKYPYKTFSNAMRELALASGAGKKIPK